MGEFGSNKVAPNSGSGKKQHLRAATVYDIYWLGGSYGYVRCALGPLAGYLCGFCESIEYILYVSAAVAVFGDLIPFMTGASEEYVPLYWLIFYFISMLTIIPGGDIFWKFSDLQAILVLLLILVYCFGCMSVANFPKYDSFFSGGGKKFMEYYPLAAWFYVGVEAMTLTCEDISEAGKKVPYAIIGCISTLFITSYLIFFVTCSLAPGSILLASEVYPLNPGYLQVLQVNSVGAYYLALPGVFSTGYGFMFAYGRQLYSMSKSGLLPVFLSKTFGNYETPYMGLIVGSAISYITLLVLYYTVPLFGAQIFNICMLGSCSVYIALARAYVVCYDRYSNLERQYKSPLGKWAAYWVMGVFGLMMVGLAFFQDDNYLSITVFIVIVVIALIYYYTVAQKREFFSEEEQEKFMKAYILNANHKRKANKSSSVLGFLTKVVPGSSTVLGKSKSQLQNQKSISKNLSVGRLEPSNRNGSAATLNRTPSVDVHSLATKSVRETEQKGEKEGEGSNGGAMRGPGIIAEEPEEELQAGGEEESRAAGVTDKY